jgi:hypothetical protein
MAELATRKMRGKKARGKHRRKEDQIASYLVQIGEWEFSFGIGNRRFNDGPVYGLSSPVPARETYCTLRHQDRSRGSHPDTSGNWSFFRVHDSLA